MSSKITKLQRWLDLIAFLVGRQIPVSVEQLMEAIPAYAGRWVDGGDTERLSVRRTFERDKAELRKLGIPIETVEYGINYGSEVVEGYRLRRKDFYLPYLRLVAGSGPAAPPGGPKKYALPEVSLTPREADLAFGALREVAALPGFPFAREARSAIRKLAFDLDPGATGGDNVLYVDRPGAEEALARVRPLSDALLARKSVRFTYHGIRSGETSSRDVLPYGLFFHRGNWYLVGLDRGREAVRVFRTGRMDGVEVNTRAPNTPDYEIPGDFTLGSHLDRDAWELGDEKPLLARVRFRFPASLQIDRERRGTLVESHADGSTVREFEVQQTNPFLRWILSHGTDATVLEPGELAEELRTMARAAASLYGGGR
jgi:proteasome accessory factor B